jgi:hypothetical protein
VSKDTVAKFRRPEQGRDLSSTIFREVRGGWLTSIGPQKRAGTASIAPSSRSLVERLTLANTRLTAL